MSEPRVHLAGPFANGLQFCVDCGEVLADYRDVGYPADQPPPAGWEPGRLVLVAGNSKRVCDEHEGVPCTESIQ
jgi:hypothetical protein